MVKRIHRSRLLILGLNMIPTKIVMLHFVDKLREIRLLKNIFLLSRDFIPKFRMYLGITPGLSQILLESRTQGQEFTTTQTLKDNHD